MVIRGSLPVVKKPNRGRAVRARWVAEPCRPSLAQGCRQPPLGFGGYRKFVETGGASPRRRGDSQRDRHTDFPTHDPEVVSAQPAARRARPQPEIGKTRPRFVTRVTFPRHHKGLRESFHIRATRAPVAYLGVGSADVVFQPSPGNGAVPPNVEQFPVSEDVQGRQ
jgi:hypothetical protein